MDRTTPGGVVGHDLADQEDFAATAGDRLADDGLDHAVAVDLGGIDVSQPKIEAAAQRRDGVGAAVTLQLPGSLPENRDASAGRTKETVPHPKCDRWSGWRDGERRGARGRNGGRSTIARLGPALQSRRGLRGPGELAISAGLLACAGFSVGTRGHPGEGRSTGCC
jgi:hypothetical protein